MSSKTVIENTPESEFEHAKELAMEFSPKSQQKAARIFEKLAEQGYSEACYMLGCLAYRLSWSYTLPESEQKDTDLDTYWFTKAFELFKKEAEDGNLKSQTHLAEMYAAGCGTKRDDDKAAYWQKIVFETYLKCAEAGDAEKQLAVSEMYKTGCITEPDLEKAVYWYNKYSEHADADADALFKIALEYLDRDSGTFGKNIQRAEPLLLKCADKADTRLLREIGLIFIRSDIRKPEVGLKLIHKSAEMGDPESKLSLAHLYLIQHETSQDIGKMRDYLEESSASEKVCLKAEVRSEIYNLSMYYQDRAEYYRELANGEYNCDAAFRIVRRLLYWNPYNPPEEAISLLKELASITNDTRALSEYILGCLYDKGLGTEKDEKTAAEWFIRAAEHNYIPSQIVAGALYLNGIGVEKDMEKAAYWLKKVSGMDGTMNDGKYLIRTPYLSRIPDISMNTMIRDTGADSILSMNKYVEIVLPWFISEADKGNAAAQLGVGMKILHERYDELSFTNKIEMKHSGLEYLKKAADQNYAPAQYHFGNRCYTTDKNKALEYMRKSADNGYAEAQEFLENLKLDEPIVSKKIKPHTRPRDLFNIEGSEYHIPSKYIQKSFE